MTRPFRLLEFVLVVGIAFGQFAVRSVLALIAAAGGEPSAAPVFDRAHLQYVVTYELTVLPILLALLWRGGWRVGHFGGRPQWRDVGRAAVLFVASYVVFYLSGLAAALARAAEGASAPEAPGLPLLLAASVVNGAFEEVFVCGYVIGSLLSRIGPIAAMNVSTVIRVSYHLYQGPFAFVWVAMIGLLFGYCYLRWRRLWPLACAHILLDFVALGARA
jgi:membrane protease YdiL (CAAX protease family)